MSRSASAGVQRPSWLSMAQAWDPTAGSTTERASSFLKTRKSSSKDPTLCESRSTNGPLRSRYQTTAVEAKETASAVLLPMEFSTTTHHSRCPQVSNKNLKATRHATPSTLITSSTWNCNPAKRFPSTGATANVKRSSPSSRIDPPFPRHCLPQRNQTTLNAALSTSNPHRPP